MSWRDAAMIGLLLFAGIGVTATVERVFGADQQPVVIRYVNTTSGCAL